MLQKALSRFLASALFLYAGAALPFTLILPPDEQTSPSNTITEATTVERQAAPIAGAIRAQLLGLRRAKGSRGQAQAGRVLVASAQADSRGDFSLLAQGLKEPSAAGGGGDSASLWISAAANSLENTFSRTAFYGATHNLLAGFDMTRSEKFVFGVAAGHEASNFTTTFNAGNERTRGFNLAPYFSYLLTPAWTLDASAGYGEFDTRQSRTVGLAPLVSVPVDSKFDSTREFASVNLTNVSTWGGWTLTGALGLLAAKRKHDAYTESDGTAVAASSQSVEQGNLLAEAAYGRGASEFYLGALYEKTRDPLQVQFATGAQPANDDDSTLLTAGWRHFGKGLTANFVFSQRVGQDQVREYGFSMMLRVDL
ncbi:MAG TPA: autotransporter outer membrane beta-barrel domain-containing protein [Burkholderiales bacterium]|nr:autotransporter outer membrane beta-barrel domain-containing protein [Burkholderiales bacterium]